MIRCNELGIALVRVAIGLEFLAPDRHLSYFVTSSLALLPLAALLGWATEQLAIHMVKELAGFSEREMKHLAVVCTLSLVLALTASNAFGWGAVTGPRGGAAYRGPMGGAAVRGPYGGAVARGPAGGVAARGPYGGAAYRGPYGGTAVRGGYGGTTVVTGGVYRPYYGAGAVAAGVAVGAAAGAAAASTYCYNPPYCYPSPYYYPPSW